MEKQDNFCAPLSHKNLGDTEVKKSEIASFTEIQV